jgi:hypothetical protein
MSTNDKCTCLTYRIVDCPAEAEKHHCTCLYNKRLCRKLNDHQCVCYFGLNRSKPKDWYLYLFSNRECRAEMHDQLCICFFGFDAMKICFNERKHVCTCNSFKHCRRHKSFEMHILWNSMESLFYWIPEEILLELSEFLKKK